MFSNRFYNRRVFVTGHTGFKGSWLCKWLVTLGAQVTGYALDPQPHETLFDLLGLSQQIKVDTRADVRDRERLKEAVRESKPEFIFHLAAQPLVRRSFEIPVETFETNVMGTAHLLDAAKSLQDNCTIVIVTTDKCYENREWLYAYREEDAMGGYDPYSASKGCAELVTAAYRRSYFSSPNHRRVSVASARAGNVIGGGDWANDRIVPDIFRAIFAGQPVPVRNKQATRPWQHVLEPVSGYLWLAACLDDPSLSPFSAADLRSPFNFGPSLASNRSVVDVVETVLSQVPGTWVDKSDRNAVHEATKLNLSIDKAFHMLNWTPTWDFAQTIKQTVEWYCLTRDDLSCAADVTLRQIDDYQNLARAKQLPWANTRA